jgi:hypothetical protein
VLGLYALLETPSPLFDFQSLSTLEITAPAQTPESGCYQEEKWSSNSITRLRFDEPLLIAFNNSIDLDLSQTETYVQIEVIMNSDIPAQLTQVHTEYATLVEGNLELDSEIQRAGERAYTFISKWINL